MEDTTITMRQSSGWLEWVRKFLPTLIIVGGGITSLVLFWDTQKNDHTKIEKLELKVSDL